MKYRKRWVVEFFYQGTKQRTCRFWTREDALSFFERKLGAAKFGLVGWTFTYPRELA